MTKTIRLKFFFLGTLFISFINVFNAQVCFLPRVDYTFGLPAQLYQPAFVATADFNNDGKQDLAVSNNATIYGVSAYLGTGLGTFNAAGSNYNLGISPYELVCADFNNNGNADIAVIGAATNTVLTIKVLSGGGTGTFGVIGTFTRTCSNASAVLTKGDYNGDGNMDLSYLNYVSGTNTLVCMFGNGLGAFPTITSYTVAGGSGTPKICSADFNKDGKDDIAISFSSNLHIRFGATASALSLSTIYPVGSTNGKMVSFDVNGDTNQDLAIPDGTFVKVLLGSATGTFAPATSYTTGATNSDLTSADYDLDGYGDLALTTSLGKLKTFLGSSTGALTSSFDYTGGGNDILSAEFTSDGKPDIISVTSSSITISVFKSGLKTFSVNNGTICSGKTFTINPTGAVTYSYSSGSAVVSPPTSTVFTVTASFLEGCNNINTSTVTVIPTPTITVSNGTVCTGESFTITPSGAVTYTYSNGSIVTPTSSSSYTVSGTGTNGCINSNTLSVTILTVQTPSICLVTLDSLANNNEIYWEKSLYTNVDSFIVYREVSTNIYKRIGAISVNAFSMYTDTNRSIGPANGNPNLTAYRYKLQIRNTCGNYGALSLWHETIFVQDQLNGNFNWNAYAIESSGTPVANYNLKRVNITNGQETLVGSTTNNIFTDPQYASLASSGNIKWFVDATGFNCNPTAKVAAQKVKTKSNHANDLIITKLNQFNVSNNVKIYPNPAKDDVVIELSIIGDNMSIEFTDVLGRTLYTTNALQAINTINTSNYVKGVYFINILVNNRIVSVKKIVIE